MDEPLLQLQSSDGAIFVIPLRIARREIPMLAELEDTTIPFPFPSVTGAILEKVIAFMVHHDENPQEEYMSQWDRDHCDVEQSVLFEIILASNYMQYKPLLDVTCKTVANMIKGKSPAEIRKTFNIKNEFTPEEEEAIRRENEWCEEGDGNNNNHA